jgi:glycosyltransferase involved in cell wall biosynthesis
MPELAESRIAPPSETREASGAQSARVALIWTDIGNYHAARSFAASKIARFDVETIEILGSSEYKEFRATDAQTNVFPCHRLGLLPPLRAAVARPALHALLSRLDPDVVFTPGWSMLESLLAIEWCVDHDVPFVIMSDSTLDDFPRTTVREAVKRRLMRLAAAAFVGGIPHVEYAQDLGMPRSHIFPGYDAVDNDYFRIHAALARANAASLRSELGLPERYFLCCSRLIEKKNVPRLVEAFARYRAAAGRADWDLVIAGPGSTTSIESLIASLGLDGAVHLVGAKGYQELPRYYGLAGAFILPSTMDQWGLVVNEAMAAGLPALVSNRCGCARDLVDEGRNGFTFDPFDIGAIADAMVRVASDSCDRAAMGAASQAIISKWAPERFAAGFEATAQAALAARQRRASVVDRLLLRALMLR